MSWVGTRDGGPFEIPFVVANIFGPDGRIQRAHLYDFDQLDARYAAGEAAAHARAPESVQRSEPAAAPKP